MNLSGLKQRFFTTGAMNTVRFRGKNSLSLLISANDNIKYNIDVITISVSYHV